VRSNFTSAGCLPFPTPFYFPSIKKNLLLYNQATREKKGKRNSGKTIGRARHKQAHILHTLGSFTHFSRTKKTYSARRQLSCCSSRVSNALSLLFEKIDKIKIKPRRSKENFIKLVGVFSRLNQVVTRRLYLVCVPARVGSFFYPQTHRHVYLHLFPSHHG
jgi:hypothetical protein